MAISNELRRLVDPDNECCCEYCLSIKCKEWALNYMVDKEIQSTGCIISSWTHTGGSGHARILVIDEKFTANTEPEAIFKACEWLLELKK